LSVRAGINHGTEIRNVAALTAIPISMERRVTW